jgi:hypothetical protein
MSYQLKLDEMLEALTAIKHPMAAEYIKRTEELANGAATVLALSLGIKAGVGSFEGLGFAGTCVPFFPANPGQDLPQVFAEYEFDTEDEWYGYDPEDRDVPEDTPSLDTSFHDHEMDVD